jgi:hypothetical protein
LFIFISSIKADGNDFPQATISNGQKSNESVDGSVSINGQWDLMLRGKVQMMAAAS